MHGCNHQRPATHRRKIGFAVALLLLAIAPAILLAACVTEPPAPPPPLAEPTPGPSWPAYQSPRLFSFPGDWGQVPEAEVSAFYPAQTSLEYVLSADHKGSAEVSAGASCASCHEGKERLMALSMMTNPLLEPDPITVSPLGTGGKVPAIDVAVKAAYDDEYLYMKFEWPSERPGIVHELWRYDGKKWVAWGGPKPDADKADITPSYEDALSVLVDDQNVPLADGSKSGFGEVGCWVTCHSSMRAMPEAPSADQVRANPYLGDQGLKRTDIEKYLLITRSATSPASGWDQVKPKEQIQTLFENGKFLDLWTWRGALSGPTGYGDDGYVLDYRFPDKGKPSFANPAQPDYMYDASKVGFNAIPEDQIESMLLKAPLIAGEDAVPFDPNAQFNVGDLLPRQVLQKPEGSRADLLYNSNWENGMWVVEMRRALDTGAPDDKVFKPGQRYNVGIAIFDDMVSGRRHHVSFAKTLGIGVDADIKAVKTGQ